MLFSLLLTALLGQAPPQDQVPTQAEAVQLAVDGRNVEALVAFQARASLNPNDHQARLWIGRLHERMGHPELAEAVFRSVLLEDTASLDAMVGLSISLLAQNAPREALEVLADAEQLAPQNPDVLALIGQANVQAGQTSRALPYLERAASIAPSIDRQMALDVARRAYFHRIETSGFAEQFNTTTPNSHSGEVSLNYRVSESLRATAGAQVQRKFDVTDQIGGGGIAWRGAPLVWVSGQVLVGPGNTVLPEADYLGSVAFAAGRVIVTGTLRYFDFEGAALTMASPTVAWPVSNQLALGLGYAFSASDTNTFLERHNGSSGFARGTWRLTPRVSLTAGYAFGIEDFDTLTIDRISDFDADTLSLGIRFDLPGLTSIVGGYERQWRDAGLEMGRVMLSFAHSF